MKQLARSRAILRHTGAMTLESADSASSRHTLSDRGRTAQRPLAEGNVGDEVAWAVVDAAPDGIVVVDAEGTMLLVNSQLEAMFGYDRGELLGRPVEHLIDAALIERHRGHRSGYQAQQTVRPMGQGNPLRARRRDGSDFLVEISLSPVDGPDGPCTVAAVRDVTSRVAIEREVQAARERSQLIDDRERLAHELHDNVIQEVFSVGMGLQSLASRLTDETNAADALRLVDSLDDIIHRIRSTIFDVAGDRISLEDDHRG